jgi:hypothetical protein
VWQSIPMPHCSCKRVTRGEFEYKVCCLQMGYFAAVSSMLDGAPACSSDWPGDASQAQCTDALQSGMLASACVHYLCQTACAAGADTQVLAPLHPAPYLEQGVSVGAVRRLQQNATEDSITDPAAEEQFFSLPSVVCCSGRPCEDLPMCLDIGNVCAQDADQANAQDDACQVCDRAVSKR